jgi:Fe-S-cluster-containing hydrogenase component 2
MPRLLSQAGQTKVFKRLRNGLIPVKISYNSGKSSVITFESGEQAASTCMRCKDTPCKEFKEEEVVPADLSGFPADKNLDVCATNAITINASNGLPIINSDLCFLCGVCANRCPNGSIFLDPETGAVVTDINSSVFIVAKNEEDSVTSSRLSFVNVQRDGFAVTESNELIQRIFSKLAIAWKISGDRFPNLLARNLLIGSGVPSSIGRKGNNHMRMDIIISGVNKIGVAEVEFGQDAVLDAPRDILDALAILISRQGLIASEIRAFIISDVLPNRRSEYWHIIQDIRNVLNIKIGTLTIFTLMMANWMHIPVNLDDDEIYYADRDIDSYINKIVERFIGRPVNLKNSVYPQVDIVK